MKILFEPTRRMIAIDKTTGESILFRDKKVLADFLGLDNRNAIGDWFRPVNGVKPKFKRYNNYEIYDPSGEYRPRKAKPDNNVSEI